MPGATKPVAIPLDLPDAYSLMESPEQKGTLPEIAGAAGVRFTFTETMPAVVTQPEALFTDTVPVYVLGAVLAGIMMGNELPKSGASVTAAKLLAGVVFQAML